MLAVSHRTRRWMSSSTASSSVKPVWFSFDNAGSLATALERQAVGQLDDVLIFGVELLLLQDGQDLFPGVEQADRGGRQVRLDGGMELTQPVAGDRGVHMVLDVVVHVPVQKADNGIDDEGAGAQAKVGDIILETGVLGVIAEVLEQAAIKRGQGEYDDELPQSKIERHSQDEQVAEQDEARPAEEAAPLGDGGRGKETLFPGAVDPSERQPRDQPQAVHEVPRIDERRAQQRLHGVRLGQDHLQVVWRVEGIFMMLLVTGPEHDRIAPADKADQVQEERVERLRLEDGLMDKLVEGVDEERKAGAVQVKEQQEDVPGQANGGVPGRGAGSEQDSEIAKGLLQAQPIAALVEQGERLARNGRLVPVDAAFVGSGDHGLGLLVRSAEAWQNRRGRSCCTGKLSTQIRVSQVS